MELPTVLTEPSTNLLEYILMVYGREGIGKTSFFASFPDALFLHTEPGYKSHRMFMFNEEGGGCHNWEIMLKAKKLLVKSDRFSLIVIDTAKKAYDHCLRYVCDKRGIPYPGEDEYGREDHGKSWNAVEREFTEYIADILKSGRGVAFTAHSKEETIKPKSGEPYTRIFPSLSGQATKVINALVDFGFYAEYIRSPEGLNRRVLITEGDEVIWAKAKSEIPIPRFLPLTPDGGFEILQAAFNGEEVGLDPATLMPINSTTPAIKKFFQTARAKEVGKKQNKVKKKKGGKKVRKRKK